ncbi:biotin/lipoyl-binding protein, partial [Methylopila musalis]
MDARAPETDDAARPNEARETSAPAAEAGPRAGKTSGSRKKLILMALAGLALGVGLWQGASYWTTGRFMVETDDAYVGADMAVMSAKISGYVAEVAVEANAVVAAGAALVRLDDGDAKLAVEAADARIATQTASLARFDRQIAASDAQILQAKAQQVSAGADRGRAASDYDRAQQLARSSYGSRQTLDQAKADRDRTAAAVD